MSRPEISLRNTVQRAVSGMIVALTAGSLLCAAPAQADPTSARRILKAMSDYMASQKDLSSEFDVELDVITAEIEKIQFSASGSMLLERPNKVRLIRKGGYSEMELVADGTDVTITDLGSGSYAQVKSPGTVDGVIDMLRNDHGFEIPGADLLLSNSYEELMKGVIEAKHIGVGVIDGVECEHLAFRNSDTDWQLWVRTGARPLPCKYVISSKAVAGAPEYTLRFRKWSTGQATPATAFTYMPAKGAKRVKLEQMTEIGELPPPKASSSAEK